MEDIISQVLMYSIPGLITGGIAFYFFKGHLDNEQKRRHYENQRSLQKKALPTRLQAYERMTLFLERISPHKLLVRISPNSSNKEDYESLLIANIEQEFEHNLTQQIYVSDQCWDVINASKNATIQLIRKNNMSEKVDSADKLREVILTYLMDSPPPSNAGLSFIRNEVSKLWG